MKELIEKTGKKASLKRIKQYVYDGARLDGVDPEEAYKLAGFSPKRMKKAGLAEKEKKYRRKLISSRHVRQASETVMMLMRGKHPADPEQLIKAELAYKAAEMVYKNLFPGESRVKHEVEQTHTFTEIPLQEMKVEQKPATDVVSSEDND